MKVVMIFNRFLDNYGEIQHIGGVETYISELANLVKDKGWDPILFQSSIKPFKKTLNNLCVIGVPMKEASIGKQNKVLYQAALQVIDKKDILIFASDICSVRTDNPRCIAIQHGISCDLPVEFMTKNRMLTRGVGALYKKYIQRWKTIKNFDKCQNRVCVDYNFMNWYRTFHSIEKSGKVWIIPNFALIANLDQTGRNNYSGDIRVLFARRFKQFRGSRIAVEVTKQILGSNNNVCFTFAGDGEDEAYLRDQFAGNPEVSFLKYLPDEALDIHLSHDIVIVPSVGSEGTCLAVAEAMGAGCAVVASGVGGITNMIIDGYNGLLAMPDVDSLLLCLQRVIENKELRQKLARNGYETAKEAFSIEIWRKRWNDVLDEVNESKIIDLLH